MLAQMKQYEPDWSVRGIKLESIDGLEDKELCDLVNSSSISCLRALNVDVDFMFSTDPEMWEVNPTFQESKDVIKSLKVVNDAAERSIALMSSFNSSLTKNEEEMQRLIQVVGDHRKRVPDSSKDTLKNYTLRTSTKRSSDYNYNKVNEQ